MFGDESSAKIQTLAGQAGQALAGLGGLMPSSPSLRSQYEAELTRAAANVTRLQSLLALLDRNPDFQQMVELMQNRY